MKNTEESKEMWAILSECSIHNGYQELDLFLDYAKRDPENAFDLAWKKISECDIDDDGMLATNLLTVMSSLSLSSLQSLIHAKWGELDDEKREALTWSAGTRDILPLSDWLRILLHEKSTLHDRHGLFSMLVRGDYSEECRPYLKAIIPILGEYDHDNLNESFREFVKRLEDQYKMPLL